ncbi:MAG: carboxymuconolactone decarboxylase family protein [Candidatus Zixiibacteriota bacterium]
MKKAADLLRARLAVADPDVESPTRCIALYAAAMTVSREDCLTMAVDLCRRYHVSRVNLNEAVLQSYLFLGFPRMLQAAEHLARVIPATVHHSGAEPVSSGELETWRQNGEALCRKVYGDSYASLRQKVQGFAPEIFQWMILEGYGKVLSRPGLGLVERELAITSMLMMENREQQLHSHMRGALRAGATAELLAAVVNDVGDAAGEGYATARTLLDRLTE